MKCILQYGPFVILGAVMLYFVFMIAKYGFRGMFFGGKIVRTLGEVPLKPRSGVRGNMKIHQVQTKDGIMFGLEVTSRSGFSADMTPLCLSPEEIPRLISLLSEAQEIAQQAPRTYSSKAADGLTGNAQE